MRRSGRGSAVIAALVGTVLLSGCLQEVPIVSHETGNKTTNMTLDEQRAWVGEQLDAAVDASGVAEGWYNIYNREVLWAQNRPEDRAKTLNSLFPRECDLGGQVDVSLKNMTADDPLAAAEKVRAFWESEGWTVTDVRANAAERDPYFRADRQDGAGLAFQAAPEGMSLSVYSACSANNTVTNWEAYGDDEPNEFEEELARREAADE